MAKARTEQELKDVKEIKRKYCQLGKEINTFPLLDYQFHISNIEHSHSKLGIFLEEYSGTDAWRQEL